MKRNLKTMIDQSVGQYIKTRRLQAGYSLSGFARKCGLSKAHLWAIEDGRGFRLSTLSAIADGFDIGAGDLLVEAGLTKNITKEQIHLEIIATLSGGVIEDIKLSDK